MVEFTRVVRHRRIAALLGLVLTTVCGFTGCDGDPITVPEGTDPFLYLVLNERTLDRVFEGTVGQHGLLVTPGPPTQSARYRTAEEFLMRRGSDGSTFGWEQRETDREVGSYPALDLRGPNLYLPDSASAPLLGALDITPGDTYSLRIVTDGVTMEGEVTVPEQFTAVLDESEGRIVATWPKVAGAAGYGVEVKRDDGEPHPVTVQTDTVFTVPEVLLSGGELIVRALDPNLYLYNTDTAVRRAGLDAGSGVLGAVTESSIRF